ncbi:hypothetical protein G2W53_009595 [Senna tora]|uniref:Uncharacterized protein n=1 Tax=Senna tora TaxID=362788 RepID=A0A835CAC0_9FABA|nr:hypothetical protein G2W53_009595 [Senna tora]
MCGFDWVDVFIKLEREVNEEFSILLKRERMFELCMRLWAEFKQLFLYELILDRGIVEFIELRDCCEGLELVFEVNSRGCYVETLSLIDGVHSYQNIFSRERARRIFGFIMVLPAPVSMKDMKGMDLSYFPRMWSNPSELLSSSPLGELYQLALTTVERAALHLEIFLPGLPFYLRIISQESLMHVAKKFSRTVQLRKTAHSFVNWKSIQAPNSESISPLIWRDIINIEGSSTLGSSSGAQSTIKRLLGRLFFRRRVESDSKKSLGVNQGVLGGGGVVFLKMFEVLRRSRYIIQLQIDLLKILILDLAFSDCQLSTSSLKETFMAPFKATVVAVTNGVAKILPVESIFLCKGGKSSSGDNMSKGIEMAVTFRITLGWICIPNKMFIYVRVVALESSSFVGCIMLMDEKEENKEGVLVPEVEVWPDWSRLFKLLLIISEPLQWHELEQIFFRDFLWDVDNGAFCISLNSDQQDKKGSKRLPTKSGKMVNKVVPALRVVTTTPIKALANSVQLCQQFQSWPLLDLLYGHDR